VKYYIIENKTDFEVILWVRLH